MSIEGTARIARCFVMEHNQAAYETSFAELLTPDVRVHEYLPGLPDPMDLAVSKHLIAKIRLLLHKTPICSVAVSRIARTFAVNTLDNDTALRHYNRCVATLRNATQRNA